MEPIDDIRAGNPPTNPELLEYLTDEFVRSGFNVRHVVALICKSRTYQLSVATNKWNADDRTNYSHAVARRLPAEVLFDAIHKVTGSVSQFPGYPAGTRAAQLAEVGGTMSGGFLQTFGRPARESACECERAGGMALGPVMAMISGPTLADAVANPKNELTKLVASVKDDSKLIDELFLRILNRPATKEEVALALEAMKEIQIDDAELAKKLADREASWKPELAKKEAERLQAVAAAKKALADYEKSSAATVAAAEKKRVDSIAAAEKALAAAEKKRAAGQAAWAAKLEVKPDTVLWQPLQIKSAISKNTQTIKPQIENDGTTVYNPEAEGAYEVTQVVGDTTLESVTAVMLEVLPDERVPSFGPGYTNRNFILTEIKVVDSYPLGEEADATLAPVKFNNAVASVEQDRYAVKTAIDGKAEVGPVNGWATNGKAGVQRAAFQLEKPLMSKSGHTLKIDLAQLKPGFMIGKFRLWVTSAAKPLSFGLPAAVAAAVQKPAAKRTAEDKTALDAYQRLTDEVYTKPELALWTARLPLPVDPQLTQLKTNVSRAEQPVAVDPQLVQLRADVAMSKTQAANARLTVVQDLAWALMNSPAFLFNR
jgi:hypothetical protein